MENNITLIPKDINDIIENPSNYPIEAVGAAIDVIKRLSKKVWEKEREMTAYIIGKMQEDNSTKLPIKGVDGVDKMITLVEATPKCEIKHAALQYCDAGFDVNEIGEYVFKPSWTRAKSARKFGGEKQAIIDRLFTRGNPVIKIEEI